MNMLTSQDAKALPAIRINAVDPGYTATDLNGHRGIQTVDQGAHVIVAMAGAQVIVAMAKLDASGPTGAFVDENGKVPWCRNDPENGRAGDVDVSAPIDR